jgi:predicted CopG family antitoxin
MMVKEEVHKKLDGCRLYGNESFSDIIDRLCNFYMDNYSGSEKVVPKFVMIDIQNNKIDLSRAKEVVFDDDVNDVSCCSHDIEFSTCPDRSSNEHVDVNHSDLESHPKPVNSFNGVKLD